MTAPTVNDSERPIAPPRTGPAGQHAPARSEVPPVPASQQLLEQHRRLLQNSGISEEVITERGYYTATSADELRRLGFAPSQQRAPALVIPICDVHGRVVLHQARPDQPRERSGKPVKYETPAGKQLALDVPRAAQGSLCDTAPPLWITEGSRKVDAATSIGLCCIGVIGVWGWRHKPSKDGPSAPRPDWQHITLGGRRVYVVFDSDVKAKREVRRALEALHAFLSGQGAEVRLVYLPAGPDGEKVGLDDFLAAGRTRDDLLELATTELASEPSSNGRGPTQAERLVELALQGDVELFHTPEREPWATVPVGEHRETMPLDSRDFRHWLGWAAHENGVASEKAIKEATARLSAQAIYDGAEHEVFVRVAGRDGAIYFDLADERRRVVEIRAGGWQVLAGEPPVKFRRPSGMRPLPEPARGGTMKVLRQFVNIEDEVGWQLLVGWLVGCLNPSGPYPLLVLHGEQGSAKSTTSRVLRGLIDPAMAELRGDPENVRDLMIAARNTHVLAFDNLSTLSTPRGWLSDALCRLATGGAYAVRALYRDTEEVLFEAKRPVILNGIEELPQRPDLLSRSLLLPLPRIDDDARQGEAELLQAFDAARPRILGGLLDAAAAALANRATVKLGRRPRMADFAVWVTAAEAALGWEPGTFIAAYDASCQDAAQIALEASPLWPYLEQCADGQALTASDLLARLRELAGEEAVHARGWPKAANTLSGMLKRLAPELRKVGIEAEQGSLGAEGDRRKVWTLRKMAETIDPIDPIDPAQCQSQISGSIGSIGHEPGSINSSPRVDPGRSGSIIVPRECGSTEPSGRSGSIGSIVSSQEEDKRKEQQRPIRSLATDARAATPADESEAERLRRKFPEMAGPR